MKRAKRRSIRFKILIPSIVVVMIISVIMGVTSYRSIYNGMVAMGIEEAEMAAKAAEGLIDGNLIKDIVPGSEETDGYQTILKVMRKAQETYGIKFLYTLYTDGKRVYYGMDTDQTENQQKVGDVFEVSYEELATVFSGNQYEEKDIDYTDDGALISVYRPIRNDNGEVVAILGSDYDADAIAKRLNNMVFKLIVVCILCMAGSLVLLGAIVQNIVNSLRAVDQKVVELVESDGTLGKQLEVHTGDELEDIADHVNTVLGHIYEQANVAKEVADGNLTVTVVPKSQNDLLGNALKQLVERNHQVLSGIREATEQAKMGTVQMADTSEALAQGATEQAAAIEQITVSVDGVAEKTSQNVKNAETATDLIMQVLEKVQTGNTQMHAMESAMKDISTASTEILKINKVIDDIAFQTRILALNAQVEAARAGEAGRGFSVVAEEVANLAEKSTKAAADVSALIEDSANKTVTGTVLSDEVKTALEAINAVVNESVEIIEEIAVSSDEQQMAILQINIAIAQVSEASQNISSASQECAASSGRLSERMSDVDRMLSVYRLEK